MVRILRLDKDLSKFRVFKLKLEVKMLIFGSWGPNFQFLGGSKGWELRMVNKSNVNGKKDRTNTR